MTDRIQSFTQLRTWQHSRQFAVGVYSKVATFPVAEQYGLTAQMKRSSISVAANIAEGFCRNTAKDKINFYGIALGSLTETESHSYIAFDLGYLKSEDLQNIIDLAADLHKMIRGLMKSAEGRSA